VGELRSAVAPAAQTEVYPLTPVQAGILIESQRAKGDGVYIVQHRFRIHGQLDVDAFRWAWEWLLRRHSILRTSVEWHSDDAVQRVHSDVALPLVQLDWRDLDSRTQMKQLEELLVDERGQGFRTGDPPLFRLTLVRTGETAHRLVWTSHHLLLDAWSRRILLDELGQAYEHFARGAVPALSEAVPYRRYVEWLSGQDPEAAAKAWRAELGDFATPMGLATRLRTPDTPVRSQHQVTVSMSPSETAALLLACRGMRVTLNAAVSGAWAILLHRYSGEHDVVFGTTVSVRPNGLQPSESLVGLCINTIPTRAVVEDEATTADWLRRFQRRQALLRAYAYSPLVDIHSWTSVRRDVPLFDTLVVFENFPDAARERDGAGLALEFEDSSGATERSLTVVVVPQEAIKISIRYAADHFDTATVERLAGHFQTLLGSIARRPDAPLHELEMLGEQERRTLLRDWNATAVEYPQRCLHQLFEEQAAARPEAVALVHEGEELSYGDLNRRANRLAHHLRDHGAGPERLVAIFLDRSIDMIVALLATLKTGAAYVPIDPDYPTARIEYMLVDSRAQLLLTASRLSARVPVTSATVISLDHDADAIARRPSTNLGTTADPDNLAYVIYTSGSTGQPKGVCLTHRNATAFVAWAIRAFTRDALRRVLVATSSSFDLFVFELFAPLAAGTTAVLVEDILSLADLPDADEITLLNTVPSACQELVAAGALPQSVEVVNLAGEALRRQLVETIYQSGYSGQVRNLYGPTECTTYATQSLVDRGRSEPTIGRPVGNVHVYVLDHSLRPLPIGVTGEIFIGGTCVARGYLNRPALTAECFVPDPFSTNGARLYRTGDLARYLPSGELEFLGRRDDQVKIRGYRIELGEIESVMVRQAEVAEAVVVAHEDESSERRLVAYYVAAASTNPSPDELRFALAEQLPDFMIPSAFVRLEEIPLTPNGKVDRSRLPAPTMRPELAQGFIAPRTPLEELIVSAWEEVLGVRGIGINDNFFELGGHSLLVMRLVARLRSTLDVELPPDQIFRSPTIATLAKYVEHTEAPVNRIPRRRT
jgi:amino acid adenylation domain-containing protein